MGSNDHIQSVFDWDKIAKSLQMRTGRIPHHHAGGQMDNLGPVFFHLSRCIFDVSAGATAAGGVSHDFNVLVFVQGKGPFTIPQCSQAFSPGAGVITITNDDADFLHLYIAPLPLQLLKI
jgi:hypothetical protein